MKLYQNRVATIVALGAASALLLGACSTDSKKPAASTPAKPGASSEAPREKATLSIAFWGDFGLKDLAKKYETENPNITIKLLSGEYAAQHKSLQQKLIAGSGAPDIAAIDSDFIVGFRAQADKFVNLLDKGAGKYEAGYLPWKWQMSLSKDKTAQIGLGTDVGGLAMCYRKDLFEKAKLPTDRDELSKIWGASWDDFIAFGKKYVAATGKKFVDNAVNINMPVLGQQPVGYFDESETLQMDGGPKVAFDTSLKIIKEGLSAGIAPWSPAWDAGFNSDAFAVLACPAWMMGHIRDTAPKQAGNWDIADIPGDGGNWGGSFLTIPKQGKHIDEAYRLLEWLIQPEQQIAIFNTVGNLPSQNALYEDAGIKDHKDAFFNNAPTGQIFTKTVVDLKPQYAGLKAAATRTAVENVLNEVQAGTLAPEAAWAKAIEAAEKAAKA